MRVTHTNFLRKVIKRRRKRSVSCTIELAFAVLPQGVPRWASFSSLLFFKFQAAFGPDEIDCFIRSISKQN